jgi:UDP-N-acetylglucosamine--N-acetylmuramyl-(pentapeptide) pyrophosphoryl-undecaprenol N-acetylglucosamine transferase
VPAIATARAIQQQLAGDEPAFLYVGSLTGVEGRLAAEAGIPFKGVRTGKLRRASNPFRMVSRANIADMFRIPLGVAEAADAVRRFQPDVVFSTGGYVSVPAVLAASTRGIPVVAHEQTVQIGLANKIIMPRAKVVALSYPESATELQPAVRKRSKVTGNPVRDGIFGGDPARGKAWAGFDDADDALPTVYVTGGAQGSRMLNVAIDGCLPALLDHCRIIHQCGKQPGDSQDIDTLHATASTLPDHIKRRYFVTQYVGPEIADVYALASLIVGRSGAGTVSEVCALGKAALFVPLVPTGGDEQTRNAKRVSDMGGAVLLPQADLSSDSIRDAITRLVTDPNRLIAMGDASRKLAMPTAAQDLAKLVIDTAKGASKP